MAVDELQQLTGLTSVNDLHDAISARQDQLSARLKQVAGWLLEHPQLVAFSTLAEIAVAAEVHASTLVRFANFFGFSGFSEMQRIYKNQYLNHPSNYQERIRQLKLMNDNQLQTTAGGLLREFVESNLLALELLRSQSNAEHLDAAVTSLHQASHIFVCGVRRAYPVVSYLHYAISQLGVRCLMVDGLAGMQQEQLRWLDEASTLIAVTFSPYAELTRKAVVQAKQQGSKVILITDSELCPVAIQADHVFTVREAEVRGFRSLNSTLCLAQSLCIALGYRLEED